MAGLVILTLKSSVQVLFVAMFHTSGNGLSWIVELGILQGRASPNVMVAYHSVSTVHHRSRSVLLYVDSHEWLFLLKYCTPSFNFIGLYLLRAFMVCSQMSLIYF